MRRDQEKDAGSDKESSLYQDLFNQLLKEIEVVI